MFGPGGRDPRAHLDVRKALAARWSKDRRTVVAMAQECRPEAFATVVAIMRDERVEAPTRLRAGELILSYSDGRPRQSVDIAIGAPREMSTLTRVELEAIAAGAPPPFQLQFQGQVIEAEVIESGAAGQQPVALEAQKSQKKAAKRA
jgi:hypothetical protein